MYTFNLLSKKEVEYNFEHCASVDADTVAEVAEALGFTTELSKGGDNLQLYHNNPEQIQQTLKDVLIEPDETVVEWAREKQLSAKNDDGEECIDTVLRVIYEGFATDYYKKNREIVLEWF